jgi:MATE family multidrug resistance protein
MTPTHANGAAVTPASDTPDRTEPAAGATPVATGRAPEPWGRHIAGTLNLALPLVGTQLAQIAMGVTDTVMIGWLGAAELAASVLATQAFFLFYIFGAGFAQAALPLAAGAQGRGDARGVRRSIRMGLWVLAIYAAAVMLPLWHIEAILRALGQAPETAALAGAYMRTAQWAMLPALMVMGLRTYLTVVGRAWMVLAVISTGALCNGVLNYAFIFGRLGAPEMGMVGAALATTLTSLVMAALLVAFCLRSRALRPYELFVRFWRADWPAFLEVIRLGWPIGATIIAEVGLFSASSLMMGWIGTIALAAHGIALQIAAIAFMIPLGLASAATVRVGVAFGRDDRADLGRAANTALVLATLIAVDTATLFWVWPDRLIALYLDRASPTAGAVLAYAVPLLLVAAAFQIADSLQAVASGILRGVKDTRTPMLIAVFSYWVIGMPVAYVLAFPLAWGGTGIWWGLALGLAAAAILLNARVLRRNRLGLLDVPASSQPVA